jgi:hypothetical protein
VLAFAVAAFVAAIVWAGDLPAARRHLDFDWFYVAGKALAHGENPYDAVLAARLGTPLFYPATMPVLMAPLGLGSERLAASIFLGLGLGCLAYGVTARGWWRLGILLSAPLAHAFMEGQWSPWLTAAATLPWLGLVWTAKPTVGLALFAGWPTRQAILGGGALILLSLAVLPGWPAQWLATTARSSYHIAPVMRPFGWLLLLAWFRWRTPEGRLIGTLALVPYTVSLLETLPLLLVAKRPRDLALLVGLGWLARVLTDRVTVQLTPIDLPGLMHAQWPYILVLCYLPALALVLGAAGLPPWRSATAASGIPSPQDEHAIP